MISTDIQLPAHKNLSITAGADAGCVLWLLDGEFKCTNIIAAEAHEVVTVPAVIYPRSFVLEDESDGYAACHIT